jgi:predicted secreted protein
MSTDALTWAGRLHDQRSRRVVFLSHCLLNVHTRYLGGAGRRGSVAEIVQPCLDNGIGMVQMPCPEEHAWGGVLKRWLLRFYGAGGTIPSVLQVLIIRLMLIYTRRRYRTLARRAANQIEDYVRSGVDVLGIVGVDGSPSCGVQATLDLDRAFAQVVRLRRTSTAADVNDIVRRTVIEGRGLFLGALQDELSSRGLHVPCRGHDLLAELEGRSVVSAVNALR